MLYTWSAAAAALAVVVAEVAWLRTGLFRRVELWLSLAIIVGFQALVDGWLTKLSAPIVLYDPDRATGWRFPWDVPVEDYLFGFAMCVLTLLLWERAGGRGRERDPGAPGPGRDGEDAAALSDR